MTIASSSRSRVAFVPETAFGTTPATPTFQEMRRTGGGLMTRKGTAVSDEIHLDRNVRDEYQLAQDPTGSYNYELTYGTLDAILAAVLFGTWTNNVLVNGATEQSFTFEETADLGGGNFAYNRFLGCEISTLALNFAARKGVTGSFGVEGRQEATDTAIISGATYTAPNTNPVETGNTAAALSIAGLNPVPTVRSLSINVSNNLRRREALGSMYANSFGTGQCDITGTMEAYFESQALYNTVLAHGGGSVSLTIGQTTTKKYSIVMPNVRFLNGERRLGGKSDDVMVSIPYRALYDGTTSSIAITRAVV